MALSLYVTTLLVTAKDVFGRVSWRVLAKSCIVLLVFAHESKVLCSKLCLDGGIVLLIILDKNGIFLSLHSCYCVTVSIQ